MPRNIPNCPCEKPKPTPGASSIYKIKLITPMVGGSALPGEIDETFPIRSTAIRGHLRHWWRLVHGHSLGAEMWRREEEIFGSTEFPSPVTVSVVASLALKRLPIQCVSHAPARKYVLFPSIDKGHDLFDAGFCFEITVSYCGDADLQRHRAVQNRGRKLDEQLSPTIAPIEEEIGRALKAWVIFGGLGARTRRGCGSLQVHKESKPTFLSVSADVLLKEVLQQMPIGFQVYQASSSEPHLNAWDRAIGLLKEFRQPVPSHRGAPRRKFPEAETLRRLTGRRSRRGRVHSEDELPSGFPRAELGLPIVFQFKDPSDPEQMIVFPTGNDAEGKPLQRMSSPIILKPIPVSPTDSIATIIVVNRPQLAAVDYAPAKGQKNGRKTSSHPITDPTLAAYPNSSLATSSKGSAIEAFLKFAGFKEVSR